jgi:hypothetical protein
MKKQLLTMALTAMMAVPTTAQNPQRGDYGYLYCHMNGNGRAWTAYALSRDGLHYHDLLGGDSVFSDTEHARIEGATRDAYIFRRHDCTGYLMLCTDMNVGAFKRLKKEAEWDNYGITLLRSDDLIHWESTSFDYRQGPAIFSDAKVQGKKPASVPASIRTGRPSTACGHRRPCGTPPTDGPTDGRAATSSTTPCGTAPRRSTTACTTATPTKTSRS